jgi:hypothetical protein
MEFRVYIWPSAQAIGADICDVVQAADAEEAVLSVMRKHRLRYAASAWAVPVLEEMEPANFEHMDCWDARLTSQEVAHD